MYGSMGRRSCGKIYGEAKPKSDYCELLLIKDASSPYKGLLPPLHLDAPSNCREDEGSLMQRAVYLPPVVPMPKADLNES
jgi:hypothetical protein